MFGNETNILTQNFFRIIMQSMSHPGKAYSLPEVAITKGNMNYNSFSVLCFTLLDHEVKFSVIGSETNEALIEHIFQLTKSQYVQSQNADYVVVAGGSSNSSLNHLNRGEIEFPDSGTTLFYLAGKINDTEGLRIRLTGPGIKDEIRFNLSGVDAEDIRILKSLNSEFPLGIDTIFLDVNNQILSIPRSSQIFMED
jgi:alpha-D-ribose 1-methylphosphonate 5-triphosphate synthase subunit PhnH